MSLSRLPSISWRYRAGFLLPIELGNHLFDFGKVGEDEIRLMRAQLLSRKTSSCDCDGARPDRFPARDVVWCVTNDINAGRREID